MKNVFFIITLILGLNFTSFAQTKPAADASTALQPKLIKMYPNPATSVVNFDFQRGYDRSFNIEVYSALGKLMYESKNIPSRNNLNLGGFYRGVYYYLLRDRNGVIIESGKFQVVK